LRDPPSTAIAPHGDLDVRAAGALKTMTRFAARILQKATAQSILTTSPLLPADSLNRKITRILLMITVSRTTITHTTTTLTMAHLRHQMFHPPTQAGSARGGPPRASWRSSATAAPPPSRASRVPMKAASVPSANSRADPSESESEDEQSQVQQPPQQMRAQQQRPLTWGYDDMSQVTTMPQTQEVIMRLPFRDWMNSGLRARE
jgi:hypothetical protein